MRWIIGLSLRLHFLVLVLSVILLVFGIFQLRQIPVDVYPEFNPPLVEVQTEALGLSAVEVESLITVPLEADLLNGVAWLDQIYSESVTGLSSILLLFEEGTDPIDARQMVQERLTQTFALPNVSKPPTMLQPLSSTNRVMMVGLSSEKLSLIEMGVLARWNIKPRLLGVPGVANVVIWGQRERQLQVQVNPSVLRANGVTLSQIVKTTGEALWVSPLSFLESSTPGTAGWIDTPNQRLSIRHELPISSPEDLAKVAVAESNFLLGDVTTVVEDHQPLIGDAIVKGQPGLILVIEKFPGANTFEVTRGVEEALKAMQPGLDGVNIDNNIFRPASYIEQAINNLGTLLLVSTILFALVVTFFLRSWKAAIVSILIIPVSLLSAVFVLYLRGETLNAIVLVGLGGALSVVIDDVVVSFENILHRRKNSLSISQTILAQATQMRSPLIFATLIIVLSVIPLFFMQGLSGAFFQPLTLSYIIAVLTSTLVALTITPAASLVFFAKVGSLYHEPTFVKQVINFYRRMLTQALGSPRRLYVIFGTVALVSASLLPNLNISLPPVLKMDLLIKVEAPAGTSHTEMSRIVTQAGKELEGLDGVKNVGAHVGRAVTGDAIVGVNYAELWVSIDSKADYQSVVNAVGEVVDGYPGLKIDLQTYQPGRISEALEKKEDNLTIRVYGNDLIILQELAHEIKERLSEVVGVSDIQVEKQTEEPQVQIKVDLASAERFRIKPGDIRRNAATLLSGLQVGSLYENQKVFDVVVWGAPEIRSSLTDIEGFLIDTPVGQAPLGQLAKISIAPAPAVIKRESVSRFIDVRASVTGGNSEISSDIKNRISETNFPLEYHAELLEKPLQKQDIQTLASIIMASAFGIFLLLQAAFKSWRLALLVFLSLPLALSGGVLSASLGGGILSIGSLVGFLAILAIGVRNSVLLIANLQRLEAEERMQPGPKLILRGFTDRLVTILMTTASIGLIFLSFVLVGDVPGTEILRPMAIVILGGLITSTLLNLFLIPVAYLKLTASGVRN